MEYRQLFDSMKGLQLLSCSGAARPRDFGGARVPTRSTGEMSPRRTGRGDTHRYDLAGSTMIRPRPRLST